MTRARKYLLIGVPVVLVLAGSAILLQKYRGSTPAFLAKKGVPAPAATLPIQAGIFTPSIPVPDNDNDRDGLSDQLETIFKTDPDNPDTDEDGYKDGTEVENGYDPTIPSPNDKLGGAAVPAPAASEQPTLTQQFANRYPEASQAAPVENSDDLYAFVNEINSQGYLPVIPESKIKVTTATGKTAVAAYLDKISVAHNAELSKVDATAITGAFDALVKTGNTAPLEAAIAGIDKNLGIFYALAAPEELKELHTLLLTATQSLSDNTKALKGYATDYVGTLVAASRIESLKAAFEKIENDVAAAEKKYNLS